MTTHPLRFKPLYQERVWGGTHLATQLGRSLPAGRKIGESWEIVDRPGDQSVIVSGSLAGRTLREAIESEGASIMGPGWDRSRPFPILVKWLDCTDRLSLQVHPPAEVAAHLGGEPKTEHWYIAAASSDSHLIAGLRRGATREAFESAITSSTVEDLIHRFKVSAGDSILVESGRLHAIDAGNLILEIQQNSDTTYRVYDWGRVGLDGEARELHIERSMQSIDFDDFEPEPLRGSSGDFVLADCSEFRIRKFERRAGATLSIAKEEDPRIVSVTDGVLTIDGPGGTILKKGDNAVLPWAGTFDLQTPEGATFLLTDHFAK
ncbi:MAG: mannose-6-phosphate isomerase [Verrucomicrobia bacterium]|nr:MAG: mannose-6-phosphate isomerase [Verrucomicrobiota bacterium]